ncbi:MAG TPA: DegT/DnrJ/EryC1/StrS aminotransferase family protein [Candidatus Limnocylindrales bacterium]|nr:DegT/DnrJ/EryC1/StrS aminotransferase family protein [Candidatus Limnocylindrales bacterium]
MEASAPAELAIPFHRPALGPGERQAVLEVLDSGWLTTGQRCLDFERAVAERLGVAHAVAVNSATAALHLALEALHIGPGDEVIVPAYTFASSGEVVRYLGARPRMADVDARSLALTAATVEAQLRPATKAVQVVHVGGLVADMAPLVELCRTRGLALVEDAAHALPATDRRRPAGTFGAAGALSFYATKTVTTGEGGMLVTDDEAIAERARLMRLHGISRDAWKRYSAGGHWYYEIEEAGFKYNLTDLAAAIGLVQLARADELQAARQHLAEAYAERMVGLGLEEVIELPAAARPGDVHAWHLFMIRLRPGARVGRDDLIERLKAEGIGTSVHFIPLHLHPYYRRTYGLRPEDVPVAAAEYAREISLPIYPDLMEVQVDRVCEALRRHLLG